MCVFCLGGLPWPKGLMYKQNKQKLLSAPVYMPHWAASFLLGSHFVDNSSYNTCDVVACLVQVDIYI